MFYILDNFISVLRSYSKGSVQFKDVDGELVNSNYINYFMRDGVSYSEDEDTKSVTNPGFLLVGTGKKDGDEEILRLANPIIGKNILSMGDSTTTFGGFYGDGLVKYQRNFRNNTDENIQITEVGLYASCNSGTKPSLMFYETFDEPVIIRPGEIKTFTMNIR